MRLFVVYLLSLLISETVGSHYICSSKGSINILATDVNQILLITCECTESDVYFRWMDSCRINSHPLNKSIDYTVKATNENHDFELAYIVEDASSFSNRTVNLDCILYAQNASGVFPFHHVQDIKVSILSASRERTSHIIQWWEIALIVMGMLLVLAIINVCYLWYVNNEEESLWPDDFLGKPLIHEEKPSVVNSEEEKSSVVINGKEEAVVKIKKLSSIS